VKRKIFFLFFIFEFLALAVFAQPYSTASPIQSKQADSLLLLLKKDKSDTGKVIHLNKLSREYINIGAYDRALYYAGEALQLAEKLKLKKEIAAAYTNLGRIHSNKGDHSKSLENYSTALKIRKEIDDKKGIAESYNNFGNTYDILGNYERALEYHLLSFKLKEAINDNKGIADSYNNIGNIYFRQGNYEQALENHFSSFKIRKKLSDQKGMADSYNNIGSIYQTLGKKEKAMENYLASLKIEEELGNKSGIADSYNNIGEVYRNQNNYEKALENYQLGLKIYTAMGEKRGLAISSLNIGITLITKSNYKEAETYLLNSLKNFKESGARHGMIELYQKLSEVSAKLNNYKSAHAYHQLYSQLKDSLYNKESRNELTNMQTKYETEKKEKQISILEKEKKIQALELTAQQQATAKEKSIRNTSIIILSLLLILGWAFYSRYRLKEKNAQEQQIAELEMKALRSQMNPHFIFNSLASIQNFIYSQNPDSANKYLSRFSKLIRIIFEQSQKKNILLADDLEAIKSYMELEQLRLNGKFEYAFHIDPNIDVNEITIPPLIIQPFIENAIWHGISPLEGNGLINIFIRMNTNGKSNILEYIIKDNGIGRVQAQKNKMGNDQEHQSKGMDITEERIKILNSMQGIKNSIEIIDLYSKNNEPCGTEVRIFIAVKN